MRNIYLENVVLDFLYITFVWSKQIEGLIKLGENGIMKQLLAVKLLYSMIFNPSDKQSELTNPIYEYIEELPDDDKVFKLQDIHFFTQTGLLITYNFSCPPVN